MTGLGKWICSVNTIFFSGDVKFEISDKDGEITVTAQTSLLPGKDVVLFLEFDDDDTCEGYVKVPMVGKIKLRNGKKIG